MDREQARERLSLLVDGELAAGEERELRAALARDPLLQQEYDELVALKTSLAQVLAPPDVAAAEWDDVALAIVARQGERLGFALLLPGAAALVIGALVVFFLDSSVPLWTRLAAGAVVGGFAFLVSSALAARLRARRFERYDGVDR